MNLFELFVKIGVDDQASKNISNIAGKLGNGLKTAAKVGTAAVATVTAAAGAMTAAFVKGTSEVAQYGDNIDKMSQKIGISAQAYQEWDFIMQHSGASVDSLQMGVKTLSQKMEKAAEVINETTLADEELEKQLLSGAISLDEYNKKYDELYDSAYKDIDAFRKLGYSMHELESFASTEELLSDVITRLQGMEEGTERTALATELLGRSGVELGALLNTSAEDTEAMRKQVHELGGVMSNEAVKAAAAYQDSLQNMQTAFSGIQRGMLSEFLPSMVTVMDGLALIFSGNDSGIAKITEGVNQFADKLMEAVPKIFELGEGILSSLATAILDNLPTLTSTATSVIIKLVDGIVSALPILAESAIEIIGSLTQGLSDSLPTIIESAVELISTLAYGILNMLPKIVQLGLDLIISLANGITESLPELIPVIFDIILQIVNTLTNPTTLANIINAGLDLLLALVDGLLSEESINSLIGATFILIDNLLSYLMDPDNILKLYNTAVDIVVALVKGLLSATTKLQEAAGELVSKLWKKISSTDWVQLGKDIISSLLNGLKQSWDAITGWFSNAWDNLFNSNETGATVNEKGRGGSGGSFKSGLDYVPYDGFVATLHKGERVLTAEEAENYSKAPRVQVIQNIYSQAQTAADLMEEALYEQERAVLMGV